MMRFESEGGSDGRSSGVRRPAFLIASLVAPVAALWLGLGALSGRLAAAPRAATAVAGPIVTDTVWSAAGSPYVLTETVTVVAGVALTIEGGVVVQGEADGRLVVDGRLHAVGTAGAPITLTSAADSGPGQWLGLEVRQGEARLEQVTVRYGLGTNVRVTADALGGPVTIQDSALYGSSGYPLSAAIQAAHRLALDNTAMGGNGIDRVRLDSDQENLLWGHATLSAQAGLEGYELHPEMASPVIPYVFVPDGITLTVEPGVTVYSADTVIQVEGYLAAVGTAAEPITFTSLADSGPGEWGSIRFAHGGGRLAQATVRYAGNDGGSVDFFTEGDDLLTIEHSTISDGAFYAMVVALDSMGQLFLDDVTFTDNAINRITLDADPDDTLDRSATLWAGTGLDGYDYYTSGFSPLFIPVGVTLTLEAGVTLLSDMDQLIIVDGHLEAVGTAGEPITLTSRTDSGPGEWGGVYFGYGTSGGSGRLAHVTVRYAGGVDLVAIAVLPFPGPGGHVYIEDSVLSDNGFYPLIAAASELPRLHLDNVLFANNAINRTLISMEDDAPLSGNATLSAEPGLEAYELWGSPADPLIVPSGVTLTIEPGVTLLMMDYLAIEVNGHLEALGTVAEPITLTSGLDNAPGQWRGLIFGAAGGGSGTLRHTVVRYAGAGTAGSAIDVQQTGPEGRLRLEYSQIAGSDWNGLRVLDGEVQALCSSFIDNEENGIYVAAGGLPTVTVAGSSISGNGMEGLDNDSAAVVDARYNWWGDASGPGGSGPGSGDPVSGNTLFAPWLEAPGCVLVDLVVAKTAGPDPVLAGEMVTYTVVVTNSGLAAGTGVVLTDTLPAGLSVPNPPANCTGSTALTCDLGSLDVGEMVSLTYAALVSAGVSGVVTNTAQVAAAEGEAVPADNVASAAVTVLAPPQVDLALAKTAAPETVWAGETVTYTLVVTNYGGATATGVVLTDTLPAGLSVPEPPGNCSGTTVLICDLDAVAGGGTAGVSYTAEVSTEASGALTNTAEVAAAEGDAQPADNVASAVVTVLARPLVSFGQAAYAVPENIGMAIITVTLDNEPQVTATVAYSASGGTATAGVDFVAVSGTLTFTPGITQATFAVEIVDDGEVEGDETVELRLAVVYGAAAGAITQAVLTIVDDDSYLLIYLPVVVWSQEVSGPERRPVGLASGPPKRGR